MIDWFLHAQLVTHPVDIAIIVVAWEACNWVRPKAAAIGERLGGRLADWLKRRQS